MAQFLLIIFSFGFLFNLFLRYSTLLQCNLDIRNPGYKEQLGYKELFSEFFFYVMGFLDKGNKFGIFQVGKTWIKGTIF